MHGQLLLLGVPGTDLSPQDAALIKEIQPGGFVLFGRNVQSPAQVRKLTDDLRDLCDTPPLIAIDQEGGRVSRTREIGVEPPSAEQLAEKGDLSLIARHGQLTAYLLRLLGFNFNLCPVLDIHYPGQPEYALRGRCYGSDPQEVITNAGVFNSNLRHYKVLSCGKHFPSCGLANADPHHELPTVEKTVTDMLTSDLLPYTALMPGLDAIMSCHTHYSAVDPESPGLPGTFSYKLLTKLLRLQLGFDGLIITDDLDMGAILNSYGRGQDIKMAIEAGNDMVMICHQVETAPQAISHLKEIPHQRIDDSLRRIEKTKRRIVSPFKFSQELWEQINADIMQLRIDLMGRERALEKPDLGQSHSPVEDY